MNDSHKLHTNIQDALAPLEGGYKVHDHSAMSADIKSPYDFAAALGYPVHRITKTLFLSSGGPAVYVAAVCSVDRRLDFKAVARAIGVKHTEVASAEHLQEKTDYPRNGVSPLGLPADIAVVVDTPVLEFATVLIGGGAAAIEVELCPSDLVHLSRATVRDITVG